ncbi:hypothetical protein [Cellulosimicrobium funkei]
MGYYEDWTDRYVQHFIKNGTYPDEAWEGGEAGRIRGLADRELRQRGLNPPTRPLKQQSWPRVLAGLAAIGLLMALAYGCNKGSAGDCEPQWNDVGGGGYAGC